MNLRGLEISPTSKNAKHIHVCLACQFSENCRKGGKDKALAECEETRDDQFYRIPKCLLEDKKYKILSIEAVLLYGILLDRRCLSVSNGESWRDKKGCVFIYFTIEEMMELLQKGNKKINQCLIELEQADLIYRKHRGLGKPNRIYVNDLLSKEHLRWNPKTF